MTDAPVQNRAERFDVVIIGTGAGGGTMLHALAGTGARILVLERGDFVPQEDANWDPVAVWKQLRYRATEEWLDGRPDHDEWRVETAKLPTVFSSFSAELCRKVIYRTWWLTGAVLSRYHRELLPAALPKWDDVP